MVKILQQLLQFVPTYLTNTDSFLAKVKRAFLHGLKPGDILFTMDVSALYFSIPAEEGIHYTMDLLESHEEDVGFTFKTSASYYSSF